MEEKARIRLTCAFFLLKRKIQEHLAFPQKISPELIGRL